MYLLKIFQALSYEIKIRKKEAVVTHIIPTVKSGNIGNIYSLETLVYLFFFLLFFCSPVVLDVYHPIFFYIPALILWVPLSNSI